MPVLDKFTAIFRKSQPSTLKDLANFLESRAAYLAQKSLAEYAQARANMMFSTLLGEKGFSESYEEARWRAYPATLAMVAEAVSGALRHRLGMDAAQTTALVADLASQVVARLRGHGPLSAADWDTAVVALNADLARSTLAAPAASHAIVQHRAKQVFDALPFHAAIKQHDFPMFRNTLAFHLTEIMAELEEMPLSGETLAQSQ